MCHGLVHTQATIKATSYHVCNAHTPVQDPGCDQTDKDMSVSVILRL